MWCSMSYGVRVRHRRTGLEVRLMWSFERLRARRLTPPQQLAAALRVLRGKLWYRERHGIGPQPVVRSYDLTGDGRDEALAMLDGERELRSMGDE